MLCAAVLCLAAPVSAAAGAAPLEPDLLALDRGPVKLCQERPVVLVESAACTGQGRTVLRVASFIGNAGQGPLEYVPAPSSQDVPGDCHGDGAKDLDGDGDLEDNDVVVQQRIYQDVNASGVFERPQDTAFSSANVACRYFHVSHDHYHVEDFAAFTVRNELTGAVVRTGNKLSFCAGDSQPFDLSLPGAQPVVSGKGYYRAGKCRQRLSTQGSSIGWYDVYGWNTVDQEIDITGIPAGYYCVIVHADPTNTLAETSDLNNDRPFRTYINPAAAPVNAQVSLKRSGTCASA